MRYLLIYIKKMILIKLKTKQKQKQTWKINSIDRSAGICKNHTVCNIIYLSTHYIGISYIYIL